MWSNAKPPSVMAGYADKEGKFTNIPANGIPYPKPPAPLVPPSLV